MTVEERATTVVEDVVATLDAELYDVELAGGVLRVTLDHEGGVGLDELAVANRAISRALDEADPIPGRYTLEVTSPGLERRLRTPAHFRGAVGQTVSVKTQTDGAAARRRGVLVAADDEGIDVAFETGEERLPYGAVTQARTVFEWGAPPKGGRRPTREVARR